MNQSTTPSAGPAQEVPVSSSGGSCSSPAHRPDEFLECEKGWIFALLMWVAGYFGAFTYTVRGGIFCNAQTANLVLLAMDLGSRNWGHALYLLIPITAYLMGAVISEAAALPLKKLHCIRWDTLFVMIEILAVLILGLLPESAPYQITQITINFICSMQYNTFRQAQNIPMATTFCTNHIRQTGIHLVKTIRSHGRKDYAVRTASHAGMLIVFVIGGIFSTILSRMFLGKSIWITLIPLAIVLADLLYADLKKEKDRLDEIPRGH